MVPPDVMKRAAEMGIDIMAICDHNSCENAAPFIAAGRKGNVVVFPGMEVCTKEEAHILGLFDSLDAAMHLQDLVYAHLEGVNDEETFGIQAIVDEKGDPIDINERLLIGATDLSIEDVVDAIHSCEGVAIASHIDRESFSIIGQLGFIPDHLTLDALELSNRMKEKEITLWQREYARFPFVRGSDAHCLDEVGQCLTTLIMNAPTFEEFRKALAGNEGRGIADA